MVYDILNTLITDLTFYFFKLRREIKICGLGTIALILSVISGVLLGYTQYILSAIVFISSLIFLREFIFIFENKKEKKSF